ncbi:MAG TPA: DUF5916 domain-containing protein [Ignavibacteria bacterium]|mgnify:CR=1 FL=1|nr:DUF5916 domain-containing protein [Ignavibacteria bacterium]
MFQKTASLILLLIVAFFIINVNSQSQTIENQDSVSIKDSSKIISSTDSAQTSDSASIAFKPNLKPYLNIPKLNASTIVIDGNIDEEVWKKAGLAENFTEINPGDNVKPEVETNVRIFYDDTYLYLAFTCYETDMASVRATMADRDRMFSDDWVGPFIDTYSDFKQAFELYTNPKGIQGDLLWTPENEDSNYDMIYDTEARMYSDRWTAEFRIPFKSLRFPAKDIQSWRVHILRNRPRGARQEIYWASVSRNDPDLMGQSGYLDGIKNIKSGSNIEILPYVLGTQNSYLADFYDPEAALTHENIVGEFGFSGKYSLSTTLTLDGTYNPDFSQVEADAPQININSPFALFFPEKRPFFLEGINYFATPINVAYTRSINHPLFAAKLTGKAGKLDIGFLSAYDQNTPYIVPLTYQSFFLASEKTSYSNILRLKYDLGGQNYIGAIFSGREANAENYTDNFNFTGYNRNFGIDGNFNFASNYYLSFQILQNNTKEFNDTTFYYNTLKDYRFDNGKYTALFDGESYKGTNAFVSFNRNAEGWSFYTEYFLQPSTVRRDNGFISRDNFHSFFMQQEYNFYPAGNVFQRIDPEVNFQIRYDINGTKLSEFLEWNPVIEFKNGINIYGG